MIEQDLKWDDNDRALKKWLRITQLLTGSEVLIFLQLPKLVNFIKFYFPDLLVPIKKIIDKIVQSGLTCNKIKELFIHNLKKKLVQPQVGVGQRVPT